jgi:hypothetical protein
MPSPNPQRLDGRCVYALEVDDRPEHVLGLALALQQLLGVDGARLVPCPACGSSASTVPRSRDGRPLSRDVLRCGACEHRWLAPDDRARVSAEWRRRGALTAAAARAALPRAIARGDARHLGAEDLPGWARFGIADALLGRPPEHLLGDPRPWAHAYALGWAQAFARLVLQKMTDSPTHTDTAQETPRARIPARVALGLHKAQAAAASLAREGKNTQIGYDYTTADQIAEAARKLLTDAGLFFVRLCVRPVARSHDTDGQLDIGNQYYSADAEITYAIVHADSGDMMIESSYWPIIVARARPHDKALAATVTYATGQILMGVLCLDRDDRNDRERNVDSRTEDVDGHRESKPRSTERTKPKPKPAKPKPVEPPGPELEPDGEVEPLCTDQTVLDVIDNFIIAGGNRTGRDLGVVWHEARKACNIPTPAEVDGKIVPIDRPARLRVSQATRMMHWLEDRETEAAAREFDGPGDPPTIPGGVADDLASALPGKSGKK